VLLIVGSGHCPLLRELVQADPRLRPVPVRDQDKTINRLVKRLTDLGCQVEVKRQDVA